MSAVLAFCRRLLSSAASSGIFVHAALFSVLISTPAGAEVRTVAAEAEHRMGDRDTKEDAIRIAIERAKHNALEQVAVYLESVTVVNDLQVTTDEIRSYTAGLVLVQDQKVVTRLEGETIVVHVDLTAQVDSEEVSQAITALRQNEDARHELIAMRSEVEQLQQQLEQANQALAAASSQEQVKAASELRQQVLNQVQANALVSQAWTDWAIAGSVTYTTPIAPPSQVQSLVAQARKLAPNSPRVVVFQRYLENRLSGATPPSIPPPATASGRPGQVEIPKVPEFHPLISFPSNPIVMPPARLAKPSPPGEESGVGARSFRPPTLHQVQPPHIGQQARPDPRTPFRVRPGTGSGGRSMSQGSKGGSSR